MAVVVAPVEGFTGRVAGVAFVDGRAETTDGRALAYFTRQGYRIVKPSPAPRAWGDDGRPARNDPKADWVAYAAAQGADEDELAEATKAELIDRYGG